MTNNDALTNVEKAIVDSAIKIYRALGPGLLPSAYQACLIYELNQQGYSVKCDVSFPVECNGIKVNKGFTLDMLVNEMIIILNTSESSSLTLEEFQMESYLDLTGCPAGYILNWKNLLKRNGIKHIAPPENGE